MEDMAELILKAGILQIMVLHQNNYLYRHGTIEYTLKYMF